MPLDLPSVITESLLWRKTLEVRNENGSAKYARDMMRSVFMSVRQKAAVMAEEIPQDLRDYTVHNIEHIDALWRVASEIMGDDFDVTPTEGFVLGLAFLLHDLGNGLAAYPQGIDDLTKFPSWGDYVAIAMRERLGRQPRSEELKRPNESDIRRAKEQILRERHADRAQYLASDSWRDRSSDPEYFLIDNVDLRNFFAHTIGLISYSHWWSPDDLEKQFRRIASPPPGWPRDWTVDELKVACLLRVADAAHIDAKRAPGFLRALRRPAPESRKHWVAQESLAPVRRVDDYLIFTSGRTFSVDDAPAWWLCVDMLRTVDTELRRADMLLSENNRPRLAARWVKGADHPRRLAELIRTIGWEPVETRIQVTDVAGLVRKLGGQQLYGDEPTLALRELIQNASDAVRARCTLQPRFKERGAVSVRLHNVAGSYVLEVLDNGLGMSRDLLRGPLLDFGVSYWGSALSREEHPGLMHQGFQPTGKYGIGFFSVFMLGQRVKVITRRYTDAFGDTRVLDFSEGLSLPPVLRGASVAEQGVVEDGGTCVQVRLDKVPTSAGGLLNSRIGSRRTTSWSLSDVCTWLCPSLDVDLNVNDGTGEHKVVAANDWTTISGEELLRRIVGPAVASPGYRIAPEGYIERLAALLEIVRDGSRNVVGRIALDPYTDGSFQANRGAVTVGGFRGQSLGRLAGVLVGRPIRAARDKAMPIIEPAALARWARRQPEFAAKLVNDDQDLVECATTVWLCGADPRSLPVALSSKGRHNLEEVRQWVAGQNDIRLVHDAFVSVETRQHGEFTLNENVLGVPMAYTPFLPGVDWPTARKTPRDVRFSLELLEGAILLSIAAAWGVPPAEISQRYQRSDDDTEFHEVIGYRGSSPITGRVHILTRP